MIPDWITLSQTAGTGNATVSVTASSYSELTKRYSSVTVSTSKKSADILFQQNAAHSTFTGTPLTFEFGADVPEGSVIEFTSYNEKTIEYSKDGGLTWTQLTASASTVTIPVSANDVVQLRGDSVMVCNGDSYSKLTSTAPHDVYGELVSITNGEDKARYDHFFSGDTGLVSSENLVLPPANAYKYRGFFEACTAMTTPPTLPLAFGTGCFREMFYNCVSLETAPALPSTELPPYCYLRMFFGCRSLTTAPDLPATYVPIYAYERMFYGCSSLNYIKCLSCFDAGVYAFWFWVDGVSPTGTYVRASKYANGTIPEGWEVIDYELKAYASTPSVSIDPSGGTVSFVVFTEIPCYITSSPSLDWFFINSPSSMEIKKAGETTITVSANINDSFAERNGEIIFSYPNKDLTSTELCRVSVSQNTYYVEPSGSVATSAVTIDPTGSTVSDSITSNVDWVASTLSTWIAISPSSGTSGTTPVTISADTNEVDYRQGDILITDTVFNMNIATISVEQDKYTPPTPPPPAFDGLCFEMLESGNIVFYATSSFDYRTIYYSKDSGSTWTEVTASNGDGTLIPVSAGENVWFSGTNSTYHYNKLYSTARHNLKGNILSLSDSTGLTSNYQFNGLFNGSTGLVSAEDLILSSQTLTNYCYQYMFQNCTNLTTAPVLPAATLANYCYASMFNSCSNLNYIKCLATDTSASNCLSSWTYRVNNTGTFVKATGTTWSTGSGGIPSGWTVEDFAPSSGSVETSSVTIPPAGGSVENSITASTSWTTTKPDWITINPSSGTSGTTSFNISASANFTYDTRVGTVEIRDDYYNTIIATINVSQNRI